MADADYNVFFSANCFAAVLSVADYEGQLQQVDELGVRSDEFGRLMVREACEDATSYFYRFAKSVPVEQAEKLAVADRKISCENDVKFHQVCQSG